MIYEGKTLETKDLVNKKFIQEYITANPTQDATITLTKIKIGDVYYGVYGLPMVSISDVGKSLYVNASGEWEKGYCSNTYLSLITGDGTTAEYTITHNLNTRDVMVQVYDISNDYSNIVTEVSRPTVNTVTIKFGSVRATGTSYKVLCVGITNAAAETFDYANGKDFGN